MEFCAAPIQRSAEQAAGADVACASIPIGSRMCRGRLLRYHSAGAELSGRIFLVARIVAVGQFENYCHEFHWLASYMNIRQTVSLVEFYNTL